MSYLPRLGALVATSALTITGLTLVAPPAAHAAADARPVAIATKWVKNQLTDGLIHNDQYNFDDIGLSIDAGFGLAAVGGQSATVGQIADAVGPQLTTGYVQSDEYDYPPPSFDPVLVQVGYYGAQAAKALVFGQVAGKDTATWGGVDLVDAVEDRIAAAPVAGRLNSDSSYGDYTNTIGQAFAARGLAAASSSKASDAVAFLLRQQCTAGYFRLALTDATCDADSAAADTDATAIAVQQLAAITSPTVAVTSALAAARTWLLGAQRSDGSFGGGASTTVSNTNSTAAAGIALAKLGEEDDAAQAAVWVRQRQADELNACPSALFAETGALAYNDEATAAARADGITVGAQDQWRRATAPAIPVLQFAPAAVPALGLTGPSGYRRAGTAAAYTVSGVVPGDKVCFTVNGVNRPVAAGANGTAVLTTVLPAGTANRTVAVKDRVGTSKSVVTKVLGSKTLLVTPAIKRVRQGKFVKVTVSGLAAAESVILRYQGVVVATGKAGANGTFARYVNVGRRLGTAGIAAYGQFPAIRKGATTITVTR
ncbi:MAG: hypothetical protein NTV23_13945 [Propionibacteriales bacterium]|nr:hypothetical protein [Propionibacteriales bacterium]